MKWQALHRACWAGDDVEVERLLDAGANPNQVAPTNWRQTPLGRTLEFRITHPKHAGHIRTVRVLLSRGANAAVRSTYLDMTPGELASFCGLEEAAEMLRATPPAEPHPTGITELWLAAASRLPEPALLDAVNRLCEREDVHVIWRQATPLMMAVGHAGHFRIADRLLDAGAGPAQGTSLLHADWHFEHLRPALRYLARAGWNPNSCDARGQTALHKAALCVSTATLRPLLALGADALARDARGLTPAAVARCRNKAAAAQALSGAGQ